MSAPLSSVATALETAAGTSTSANQNEAGYWLRVAVASESLSGAGTSANLNTNGYMLRTALALESLAGTDGDEENTNYSGYLKRIVDALEVQAGQVNTGSLIHRLTLAAAEASFGSVNGFENGTFEGNSTIGWALSRVTIANEKLRMVNSSGFPGFARYTFPAGLEDGATYRIEFDLTDFISAGSGNRTRVLGGTPVIVANTLTANGHYSFDMVAGASTETFQISSLSDGVNNDNFSLDNFVATKL